MSSSGNSRIHDVIIHIVTSNATVAWHSNRETSETFGRPSDNFRRAFGHCRKWLSYNAKISRHLQIFVLWGLAGMMYVHCRYMYLGMDIFWSHTLYVKYNMKWLKTLLYMWNDKRWKLITCWHWAISYPVVDLINWLSMTPSFNSSARSVTLLLPSSAKQQFTQALYTWRRKTPIVRL